MTNTTIESGDKVRLANGRTANVLTVLDKRHRGYAGLLLIDEPLTPGPSGRQWQHVRPEDVVKVS